MKNHTLNQITPIVQELLEIQNTLNTKYLGAEWTKKAVERNVVDYRAAIVDEAAELLRSDMSWKFWTKEVAAPNLKNERIEFVDILHFLMSDSIAFRGIQHSASQISEAYMYAHSSIFGADSDLGDTPFRFNDSVPRDITKARNELYYFLAASNRDYFIDAWFHFARLGFYLGISFGATVAFYRGKAVLNSFRIDNGYKNNTYIKEWAPGMEDNDMLTKFIEDYQKTTDGPPPSREHILQYLTDTYSRVKATL
jgi:hypothetical protein